MLRNYLKIVLRSLARNSVYPLINCVGLSIGIACSILCHNRLLKAISNTNRSSLMGVSASRCGCSDNNHYNSKYSGVTGSPGKSFAELAQLIITQDKN